MSARVVTRTCRATEVPRGCTHPRRGSDGPGDGLRAPAQAHETIATVSCPHRPRAMHEPVGFAPIQELEPLEIAGVAEVRGAHVLERLTGDVVRVSVPLGLAQTLG